jgi:deazaflavin-dependent oxidoreductase (nitroreductase family)
MARMVRLLTRPRPIFTAFTRLHARVLRLSRGRIRRSVLLAGGQPVLSLTTTGRRSGQSRSTVVAYMRDGGAYVVTAVTLGSERDPAWFLNLDADPQAEIDVEGKRIAVVARRAMGSERQRLWDLWLERLPATEAFSEIAGREIPVLVLEPAN